MSVEMYKSKAEWLEMVMSSDLTPGTKVFAWAVFKRMYGDKIESHPGKSTIQEDSHLNPSKYKDYRNALVGCGALDAVREKSPSSAQENYRYTLNLEWEGGTHRDTGGTPEGYRGSPTGVQGGTQRDTGVYPTGSSNTSIQDFNESSKRDFKEDASLADAPEAANLDSQEPLDVTSSTNQEVPSVASLPSGSKFSDVPSESTSSKTSGNADIHEDSSAGGAEGSTDSKSSKTSTSSGTSYENKNLRDSEETCESEKTCGESDSHGDTTTPEGRSENNLVRTKRLSDQVMGKTPANKKKGELSPLELDRAAANFIAGCDNQQWRNVFNWPGNREKVVLRAGKPEYYHLGAEERVEAVMIAICGGKEVTK